MTAIFPTPSNPAFGSYVRTQAEALQKAGVDVRIFVLTGRNRKLMYLQAVGQLQRRLVRTRFDLIHAHYGYVGMVARTQRALPVVVTFHGSDVLGSVGEDGRRPLFSKLVARSSRVLARTVDSVIVQSAEMAATLETDNSYIIPHEVDLALFAPVDREQARALLGLRRDRKYLLFAADPRISVKRFPLAKAVADRLAGEDSSVELLVVYREPQPRLALYMNAADCLIFPSYQEGSPNIVKQAMACNLPIVATDVGDVRAVIGETDGCYVCAPSAAELAEKARGILRAGARTDGRQAVQHLDAPAVAGRVIGVYEDTIRRARVRRWSRRHAAPDRRLG